MSIENPFNSQPPAPSAETPELPHNGFRVGQKVDLEPGILDESIDTGGGWEIKDFITRTAGDKVIESAKVVSLNGLHEDTFSVSLLRPATAAYELNISARLNPEQPASQPVLAEPAELAPQRPPQEFEISQRLDPESPNRGLADLADPEVLKAKPTAPEISEKIEFQTGDTVKALNRKTGQLEDWVVGVVVANNIFAEGGTVTLIHQNSHETRSVTVAELTAWNNSNFVAPEPEAPQPLTTEIAAETSSVESTPEPALTTEPPIVNQVPQSRERKKATPEVSAEIQASANQFLDAYEAGDRPQFMPWRLKDVAKAYGFSARELKTATPVQLLEHLQALVRPGKKVELTPEAAAAPEVEPIIEQPIDNVATPEAEPPFHDGQQINYQLENGGQETDWTILNPRNVWTGFIAIQKSNGRVQYVALDDLKKWNPPVAEAPTIPEAEATPESRETESGNHEFSFGQEVKILNKDGSLERGWFVLNITIVPNPTGDQTMVTLRSADGKGLKLIAEDKLREWNSISPAEPATPDNTAPETKQTVERQEITAQKYSPEWVQQVLQQFNIKPSELAGFDQLTEGQQALALENFQNVMIDQVQARSIDAYNKNTSYGLVGKIWRGMFKEVYLAKEKRVALTKLETTDSELNKAILQQSIEGLKKQNPEIGVENGTLTLQYLNAERLGITGEPTPEQAKAIEQFNNAANDFAGIPEEWRLTGNTAGMVEKLRLTNNKSQQEQYQQAQERYKEASDQLLIEISKTQDAPAVELSLNKANYDIQLQRQLTNHPEVEKEFQKIRSPKVWVEALKTHFTEKGMYTAAGFATRWSAASFLGAASTIGIVLAAPVIGGWRSYERSKRTLKERAQLARKGVTDTSGQRATMMQDVTKNVSDYRTQLLAEQQEGELLLQQAKTPEDQASLIAKIEYVKDQLATPDEELAGGKGGLVTRLEDLKQRFEAETDPVKKSNLKRRLVRRIDYTHFKLTEGLVNFGTVDQRVLNHYHLMQTMSEVTASAHGFDPKLEIDTFMKQQTQHEKIQRRLNNFTKNQLHIEDKARQSYMLAQTAKGATYGLISSTAGYLISHFSELARGDFHPFSQHHGDAQTLEHAQTSGTNQDTSDLSQFEAAATHHTTPLQQVETAPAQPAEPLTEIAQRGDSAWKLTERHLSEHFKDKFANLNEAQKTYLVDAIKDKMQAHPEQFGFHAGQSIDQLEVGQTINFDAITKDQEVADLLFKHAEELQPEQMASIVHNNEILHHWVVNNPGETLTADNVDAIIDGTHQLGLTPEILEQAATEGGKNMLTIDQELPYTTVNEFINQVLYGHPQGHEALLAQVKEALHDDNYLDSIEQAHHYDSGEMTAGWLKTDHGQEWLDRHNGEIWQQDGRAYTVVQETAASAKKVAEKATETAQGVFETVGADTNKLDLDLVTSNTATAGRKITMWAIYRAKK